MVDGSVARTLGQIPDDEAWHRTIILPRDILDNPPSGEHEVDWETESSHRIWGCELLQEAGVLLRLPQVVMCTAQNLLQRFFYRKPLTKFDAFSVAMGCMLLAMKIEEDPRQPRAVVLVFHRMFERRIGVDPAIVIPPESLRVLRDEMLRVELHVLKELGFGFYNIMDHPHKFILYYLRVLELDIEGDVSQRAWNYVNDSLRTDLSLRFRSEVMACAAIYMASRSLGIKLPDNPPWWVLFNADMQEMGEICNTILALYHRPKVAFLEPLCDNSVFRRGGPLRIDAVVQNIQEVYAPADGVEEPPAAAPSGTQPGDEPCTRDSVSVSAVVAEPVSNNSVSVANNSPEAPGPSDVHEPDSNGAEEPSTNKSQERESDSRSESRSNRSHSASRSALGIERERGREDGADREANGRPSERVQDRERDRKRPREKESRRSRSRSRSWSRNRRDRRGDSRERGRDRPRERDRERARGRDWGRDRDREKERNGDRRHDRGDAGRRSRR
ncbi:unnamed protein product [Ectocarpus sp. 6 AP-2014]